MLARRTDVNALGGELARLEAELQASREERAREAAEHEAEKAALVAALAAAVASSDADAAAAQTALHQARATARARADREAMAQAMLAREEEERRASEAAWRGRLPPNRHVMLKHDTRPSRAKTHDLPLAHAKAYAAAKALLMQPEAQRRPQGEAPPLQPPLRQPPPAKRGASGAASPYVDLYSRAAGLVPWHMGKGRSTSIVEVAHAAAARVLDELDCVPPPAVTPPVAPPAGSCAIAESDLDSWSWTRGSATPASVEAQEAYEPTARPSFLGEAVDQTLLEAVHGFRMED